LYPGKAIYTTYRHNGYRGVDFYPGSIVNLLEEAIDIDDTNNSRYLIYVTKQKSYSF
jgi:hypothetical protein